MLKLFKSYTVLTAGIAFLCCSSSAQNYSFYPNTRFWETPWLPGQLLQSLDRVSGDTRLLLGPQQARTTSPQPTAIQRRAELPSEYEEDVSYDVNTDDKNTAAAKDGDSGEYYYDRAYEEFVRRYFGRSAEEADAAAAVAASLEAEEQDIVEQIPEASTTQKCKKVRRKQQHCEICENSQNGEKSESCSYSTESEPHRYSYGNERNFKRSRNSGNSDESSEDDVSDEVERNDENSRDYQAEAKKPNLNHQRQQLIGDKRNSTDEVSRSSDSSSCVKKTQRNRVCYYCKRSDGKKMVKCYAQNAGYKTPNDEKKPHKVKKIQQRIYKRTVTHSSWKEGH